MVFKETKKFARDSVKLLGEMGRQELFDLLIDRPQAGVIPRQWGGLRKLRFAAKGRGKSGGVRVVYYWIKKEDVIILVDIYAKNKKMTLTAREVKRLRQIIDRMNG